MVRTEDQTELRVVRKAEVPQLVSMASSGSMSAFEELVRRYRNEVYALAYHFTRNREDAWDLSQEVFIKAHRGLASFRGDASFKTWLLRITANQCKDHLKKRRLRVVALEDEGALERMPAHEPGPADRMESSELGEAIAGCLNALPAKHRMALVLREYQGLSYEEMAEVMRCSVGTVMSRLHHARRKMRNILIRKGIVEGNER